MILDSGLLFGPPVGLFHYFILVHYIGLLSYLISFLFIAHNFITITDK